jgi:hypothetical protein
MSTEEKREERQARVASFDRQETGRRILIALSILTVVGLVMWWQSRSPIDPPNRRAVASLCLVGYKDARSAAETANVDIRTPIMDRRTDVAGISCGDLRRANHLDPYPSR